METYSPLMVMLSLSSASSMVVCRFSNVFGLKSTCCVSFNGVSTSSEVPLLFYVMFSSALTAPIEMTATITMQIRKIRSAFICVILVIIYIKFCCKKNKKIEMESLSFDFCGLFDSVLKVGHLVGYFLAYF